MRSGRDGIFINMARGSVVDEAVLIKALQDKRIMAAGLDVYAKEPQVPKELIAMDNVVLFPHVGSATVATRAAMDQLVVDNLLAWGAGKPPLTPGAGNALAAEEAGVIISPRNALGNVLAIARRIVACCVASRSHSLS